MTRTRWGLILLLFLAGLLAAMQFAKLSLTLEDAAAIWPDRPVAFLVSAVSIVGAVFGAVAGAVVARFGARPAILWAVGLSGALSLMQAALPPFAVMIVLRALEGAGHLALVVALPTLMAASAAPRDRTVVMGLWGTFFGVGFMAAAFALDASASLGPSSPYWLHGVACLLLLPVLIRVVPRITVQGVPLPGIVALHRSIYTRARTIAPGVGHGIYTSLFIALVALLPMALDRLWLVAVLPASNLLGTFVAGVLGRVVAPRRIVAGGYVAAGAGFFLLALGVGPVAAIAVLSLFATGLLAGGNFAAVPALNDDPADQALANGGMAQLGNVGTFAGTPLLGAAFAAGGPTAMLAAVAGLCAVGAIVSATLYRRAAR